VIGVSISLKFAEMAIKVWKGDRSVYDDLKKILPTPDKLEVSDYGFVGEGPDGVKVGLQYGLDPVNALVQIGFLYAGMMWPFLPFFQEANKLVRKMWRDEIKKRVKAYVSSNGQIKAIKGWKYAGE
jgi:uncharacterized protein (UPF0297 family)